MLVGCCVQAPATSADGEFSELYVADFATDEPEECTSRDIDFSHAQARDFFRRARQVEYRVIHDHYPVAPCYMVGVVQYRGQACDWKIRPGGTASIRCGDETRHFVCDDCEDLLSAEGSDHDTADAP